MDIREVKAGDLLRLLRDEKGLTQDDLADLLKVKRQTYSAWERNISNPDISTIDFLANYYNVSVDYLLGRTDIKNNTKSEQAEYIESLKLDTPEDAIKFILQQPSIMEFGGYNLNEMDEEEIIDLANDLLFAMKLSLGKHKKK